MVEKICEAKDFGIELVQEVGKSLIADFSVLRSGSAKCGNMRDLLTEADLESERKLISAIRKVYPRDGILSEEGGFIGNQDEYLWVLDPLCGTTNYSQGITYFGISIALARHSEVILGIIYGSNNEVSYAIRGEGAFLASSRLHVSNTNRLSQAFVCVEWGQSDLSIACGIKYFERFAKTARKVRFYGSAALNLANLAAGRLDAYIDQLEWWDFAAGALIVEEAGGKVTDSSGLPITSKSNGLVATNSEIHASVLQILSEANSA